MRKIDLSTVTPALANKAGADACAMNKYYVTYHNEDSARKIFSCTEFDYSVIETHAASDDRHDIDTDSGYSFHVNSFIFCILESVDFIKESVLNATHKAVSTLTSNGIDAIDPQVAYLVGNIKACVKDPDFANVLDTAILRGVYGKYSDEISGSKSLETKCIQVKKLADKINANDDLSIANSIKMLNKVLGLLNTRSLQNWFKALD